jgi:hypothetical protein
MEFQASAVQILMSLLLFVCTTGIVWLVRLCTDLRSEFRLLNGRLIGVEEWRIGKERLDEERHDSNKTRLDRLEE